MNKIKGLEKVLAHRDREIEELKKSVQQKDRKYQEMKSRAMAYKRQLSLTPSFGAPFFGNAMPMQQMPVQFPFSMPRSASNETIK